MEPIIPKIDELFDKPFKVSEKKLLTIIDDKSREVAIFRRGLKEMAQNYCDFLNSEV